MKIIRVDYEIMPMRAIYAAVFLDDEQADEDVKREFLHRHPRARILNIIRKEAEDDDFTLTKQV